MSQFVERLRPATTRDDGDRMQQLVEGRDLRTVVEFFDLAVELIADAVAQGCTLQDRTLDSGAISAYAAAMHFLEALGQIEVTHEAGRRVLGRWKPPTPVASDRDWPEDFGHENGNYMHTCIMCDAMFRGDKGRTWCRVCAKAAAQTLDFRSPLTS